MAKIYDYNSYNDSRKGASNNSMIFEHKLEDVDIDIHNAPEEYSNIMDCKAHIKYSVSLDSKKYGITDIYFNLVEMELVFNVDDYPNPPEEFDFDIIPGKTIDIGQVNCETKSCPIPTTPDKISVDMNGSTDSKRFNVTIEFGVDRDY